MTRVKRGFVRRRKHKTTIGLSAGFRGKNRLFRVANQRTMKALTYAYDGRKQRKREFRRLWIVRLGSALINVDRRYGEFVFTSAQHRCRLNRKCLSQMAIRDPGGFHAYVCAQTQS